MTKCMQCGHAMTTKRENVPYKSLPGTVLVGVEVSRCPQCGETEVAIPAIEKLNRVLAAAVVRKLGRLNGGEIRFLRTYLGLSGSDFADVIQSDKATVSRWESDKQQIGHHADLLLRTLVMLDKKVEKYPLEDFKKITDQQVKSNYAVTLSSKREWQSTGVAA
ncbi:MAG TPA: type II TA system antitoxin MqsA family protein [Kofleriaceae bacterium]|jgi:putative zinc finger/helix-turn-helix YgiT family protein